MYILLCVLSLYSFLPCSLAGGVFLRTKKSARLFSLIGLRRETRRVFYIFVSYASYGFMVAHGLNEIHAAGRIVLDIIWPIIRQ